MKILFLAADFPPAVGGIQTMLIELLRRLPDEIVVLAPGPSLEDGGERFRVIRVTRTPRLGFLGLARMLVAALRVCAAGRPDLVVCGHVITGPVGLFLKWVFRRPYVVLTYAWEVRRKRWSRLLGRVLHAAAAVVAISRFTREAVRRFGVPDDRIHVIWPGVDPERFSPSNGTGALRAPRPPTLLTVARLDERHKGHDSVIRALPLIRAKVPEVRYVVAGEGRLRDYLEILAADTGVSATVVFAGGVPASALSGLYRECDVFVLASRDAWAGGGSEGFGIVCLEAAAAAKPVIAGRSGGLPEAVEDGVSGLVVDGEDLIALADAAVRLLTDPAFAGRLGEAGRQRVLRQLTWDHARDRLRTLFTQVVDEHDRG